MTTTDNVQDRYPACQCGCCGPTTATVVTEPPAVRGEDTTHAGCGCGCTDRGCGCGCGDSTA